MRLLRRGAAAALAAVAAADGDIRVAVQAHQALAERARTLRGGLPPVNLAYGSGAAASVGHEPWQPAPSFAVPTLGGGEIAYDASSRSGALPLVVAVVDVTDPFMAYMVADESSVDGFLSLTPVPAAQFLFLSTEQGEAERLQSRILQRLDSMKLSADAMNQWRRRLHFGSTVLRDLRAKGGKFAALPEVLDSFKGIRKYLRYLSMSTGEYVALPRLDCNFQWSRSQGPNNHSPPNPIRAEVAYVPHGCSHAALGNTSQLEGRFALVFEEELSGCTAEEAVVGLGGAVPKLEGVIVMARQGAERLRAIGDQAAQQIGGGSSAWPLPATMVAFDARLLAQVHQSPVPVIYECNETTPGSFVVIDAQGLLHEAGHVINPWLRVLGWAGQYWAQEQAAQAWIDEASTVVRIFQNLPFGGDATVDLSDFLLNAGGRSKLALETELRCPGPWNADCGVWDHVATVAARCGDEAYNITGGFEPGGSFKEIGRFVTPYRLGIGRWVTDVTALAPLLRRGRCTFTLAAAPWTEKSWIWSMTLRASGKDVGGALPVSGAPLFSNNEPVVRQTFDGSYNAGRKRSITVPKGTSKVDLYVLISGHGEDETGCCEFLPSRHVFTLNGRQYPIEFNAPHDLFGCARPVDGVEPNGGGGWWMGRNGWCPGQEVRPIVVDVTEALASESEDGVYEVSYAGWMWDVKAGRWMEPAAKSGYVVLASHLAFYA